MKIAEVGFAACLVLTAVVYGGVAIRMPRGDLSYPGPGFFPVAVSVFFLLTALAALLQAIRTTPNAEVTAPAAPRIYRNTAMLLVWLVAYGVALKPLGFPVSLVVFLAAAIRIFGLRRWFPVLAIAAGLTVISYVAFVEWLKVPIPMGVVGELLD